MDEIKGLIIQHLEMLKFGIKAARYLEQKGLYKEVIITYRSCIEEFCKLVICLLAHDLIKENNVYSLADCLYWGRYRLTESHNSDRKETGKVTLRGKELGLVILKKDKTIPNDQLRSMVIDYGGDYISGLSKLNEYFIQFSNVGSHSLADVPFSLYNSYH